MKKGDKIMIAVSVTVAVIVVAAVFTFCMPSAESDRDDCKVEIYVDNIGIFDKDGIVSNLLKYDQSATPDTRYYKHNNRPDSMGDWGSVKVNSTSVFIRATLEETTQTTDNQNVTIYSEWGGSNPSTQQASSQSFHDPLVFTFHKRSDTTSLTLFLYSVDNTTGSMIDLYDSPSNAESGIKGVKFTSVSLTPGTYYQNVQGDTEPFAYLNLRIVVSQI